MQQNISLSLQRNNKNPNCKSEVTVGILELGPTELVVLESKNMFMDYTFLMEDDTYIHFEFQTTNKGVADLRRFRAYEALLSHQTGIYAFDNKCLDEVDLEKVKEKPRGERDR